MIQIKIFKTSATVLTRDDINAIENDINKFIEDKFIKDKNVIDIKQSISAGNHGDIAEILYTVIYEE